MYYLYTCPTRKEIRTNNLSKNRKMEGQAPDDIAEPDNRKPKHELRKERDQEIDPARRLPNPIPLE
jgi:hypothetical protein